MIGLTFLVLLADRFKYRRVLKTLLIKQETLHYVVNPENNIFIHFQCKSDSTNCMHASVNTVPESGEK